jgi:hypothetical protein
MLEGSDPMGKQMVLFYNWRCVSDCSRTPVGNGFHALLGHECQLLIELFCSTALTPQY